MTHVFLVIDSFLVVLSHADRVRRGVSFERQPSIIVYMYLIVQRTPTLKQPWVSAHVLHYIACEKTFI